jgi:hypothetical protein
MYEVQHYTGNLPSERFRTCGSILWSIRQDSNLRALRSQRDRESFLARTLENLVGELRIELSPLGPKARMQFPACARVSELKTSLKIW